MLVYRSVFYGISCFFGPELPFKFLDICCFRSVQWRTRRAKTLWIQTSKSITKWNPQSRFSLGKFKTLKISESEVSGFFLIPRSSFNHYMIFKKKSGIFTKNDGPSPPLPKAPNRFLPPSTTPAAHGAARRPTARRSLHHRPQDWHRRQQLFVTSVRVTGPVQLMKEIRGSPVDVGRVLGLRV